MDPTKKSSGDLNLKMMGLEKNYIGTVRALYMQM